MNRQKIWMPLFLFLTAVFCVNEAFSQSAGWQASLSNISHNVSGMVTIVDENTLQFDDFTFDGGGLDVYFYWGATNSDADFSSGLEIGNNLVGMEFDGTQPSFTVDLPTGETIGTHSAVSVWCTVAAFNFGSGEFQSVSVLEPSSTVFFLVATTLSGIRRRRH